METVNEKLRRYRQVIKEVLAKRAAVPYIQAGMRDRTLFNEKSDSYAVVAEGGGQDERIHHIVLHREIINGKVWIQADNTAVAVARELEEHGIPKSDIVQSFRTPDVRPYTEYAAPDWGYPR